MFSIYIILFYAVLLAIKPTRKLALALTPWLIFACSYDWMRLLPNYEDRKSTRLNSSHP